MNLKDKVVLITGSSIGIGKETALLCAKAGAKVVITYYKDDKEAKRGAEECEKVGAAGVLVLQLNVMDDDSIRSVVKEVTGKFGRIDVLVNNAGVISWKPFAEQAFEEIEKQVRTNLEGLVKMTSAVLPHTKMIVNIASGAGKTGYADLTTYCATKFGVRGFTQALAEGVDIPVVCVNPGMTSTRMTNYRGVPPEKVAQVIVDAITGKIQPDEKRDVDVWDHV